MNNQNLFLEIASDQAGVLGLSSNIGEVITDYVERALAGSSRARSYELEQELVNLLHEVLKRCPLEALLAVQGMEDAGETAQAAYVMGQISFAQALVSQNVAHKVCDEFKAAVLHELNVDYVRALYSCDLTNKQLVGIVGKVEESVSRRLKKLREWGITDSRKQGVNVINFLTPAARKVFENSGRLEQKCKLPSEDSSISKVSLVTIRLVERKTNALPSHMKSFSALGGRKVA